jgi:hypothetical protein
MRSPPTTTQHDFFFLLSCCRERTGIFLRRALNVEGCYLCLSVCFSVSQGWINFFSLPDGLDHLFESPIYIYVMCDI